MDILAHIGGENRRWRYPTPSELDEKILSDTLPRINAALEEPTLSDCPNSCLCHNVDEKRIASLLKQFSDDSFELMQSMSSNAATEP